MPSGDRKSGMPESVEMPAPVNTTIRSAPASRAAAASTGSPVHSQVRSMAPAYLRWRAGRIRAMRIRRGVRAGLLVAALASVAWLTRPAAAGPPPNRSELAGSPGVLVLVRQLAWDQAASAARRQGAPVTAGLVSTLPSDASLPDRVLSLATGRQVDAAALEGTAPEGDGDGAA